MHVETAFWLPHFSNPIPGTLMITGDRLETEITRSPSGGS